MDILNLLNLSLDSIKTTKDYRIEAAIKAVHTLFNESIKNQIGAEEFKKALFTKRNISAAVYRKHVKEIKELTNVVNGQFEGSMSDSEVKGVATFLKYALLANEKQASFMIRHACIRLSGQAMYSELLANMFEHVSANETDIDAIDDILLEDISAISNILLANPTTEKYNILKVLSKGVLKLLRSYTKPTTQKYNNILLREPNNLTSEYSDEMIDGCVQTCFRLFMMAQQEGEHPYFFQFLLEDEERQNQFATNNKIDIEALNYWMCIKVSGAIETVLSNIQADDIAQAVGVNPSLLSAYTLPYGFHELIRVLFISLIHFELHVDEAGYEDGTFNKGLKCFPMVMPISEARSDPDLPAYLNMRFHQHLFETNNGAQVITENTKFMLNDADKKEGHQYIHLHELENMLSAMGISADSNKLYANNIDCVQSHTYPKLLQDHVNEGLKHSCSGSKPSELKEDTKQINDSVVFDSTLTASNFS